MKSSLLIALLHIVLTQNLLSQSTQHDFYNFSAYIKNNPSESYDITITTDKTSEIDPRYDKLIQELAYMQVFAVASIGVIAALPEGVSNWSDEDKAFTSVQDLLDKHAEHLEQGPKQDNDNITINYVGHSLVGSYFYVWGRQSGLSWQESAILTTLMSTFYWEYGWEAFAEVPSTQDLIITPLLGSILGEGTNYLYNTIIYNDSQIYGSYFLGTVGKVLLNPIGEMNRHLDSTFHAANIEISVDYSYNQDSSHYKFNHSVDYDRELQSYFRLNFKLKY